MCEDVEVEDEKRRRNVGSFFSRFFFLLLLLLSPPFSHCPPSFHLLNYCWSFFIYFVLFYFNFRKNWIGYEGWTQQHLSELQVNKYI